jgi:hypothetical protein
MSFRVTKSIFRALTLGALASGLTLSGSLAPPAAAKEDVTFLKQGWSDEDRLQYYFTSQGTAVMPYDLFVNLEEAASSDLIRSERIVESLGMIPQAPDPKYNPDGLPVGITRAVIPDGRWKGEWVGINCALCHTDELRYRGKRVRIDGGAGMHFDFGRLIAGLDEALAANVASPEKFDRLAARMKRTDAEAKADLRKQLEATAKGMHGYVSFTSLTPFPSGPGRLDCLGDIHNRVAFDEMAVKENWAAVLAPTKMPFVWNAPQSSWVQWSGVASNPLTRNAGEALGVFIKMDLTSKTPEDGLFDSTVDLKGQIAIENVLRKLAPPKWPEDILGPIDRTKAAEGQKLFVENCSECHSVWPHRWSEPKLKGKRFIENAMVPQSVVGTDPMQFHAPQFNPNPINLPAAIGAYLEPPYKGAVLAPYGAISLTVNKNVTGRALAKVGLIPDELEDASGYVLPNEKGPVQPAYKAGPRDGVWATPPFLHNGSVPNLYELLLPARERSKTFYLGTEFDAVKVGVDTSGASGKVLFDTSLVGNSNAGHSFEPGPWQNGVIGRLLTDEERWALIEYLKSIPTEDAQVTPYGGPANPVSAWSDPHFFNVKHPEIYNAKY